MQGPKSQDRGDGNRENQNEADKVSGNGEPSAQKRGFGGKLYDPYRNPGSKKGGDCEQAAALSENLPSNNVTCYRVSFRNTADKGPRKCIAECPSAEKM